jgi:hypothetical protein
MQRYPNTKQSGLLFIELIIVSAISVIIFGAMFVAFQFTLELVSTTRAKLGAASLANERMEFFRSLPYTEVGTQTGIIRGPVANNQVITLNDIDFTERIVIDYVDGVGDGIGGADFNGITNDYKRVKLSYTWEVNQRLRELSIVSDIMPRGVETDVGGGSIRINVLDPLFQPLPGATVEISNASTTAPLFESRVSNLSGEVLLSGVPADSDYELLVTGPISGADYSVDSTYPVTAENDTPVRAPFAVVEGGISTLTFTIGELSDMDLRFYSDITTGSATELFTDSSGIASSTGSTTVQGGELVLADTAGVYEPIGTVFLDTFTPATLERWGSVKIDVDIPLNTNYTIQLYTGDAVTGYTLIPDGELPGNSTGFTDTYVDLQTIDSSTHPSLVVGVTLGTTDDSVTPSVSELAVYWRSTVTTRSGFTVDIQGEKAIGSRTDSSAIYKSTSTVTTNSVGEATFSDAEFDRYSLTTTGGLDIAMACPAYPIIHQAGIDSSIDIVYVLGVTDTLRVVVQDTLGRVIPGAAVQLELAAYNQTQTTGSCGQTFFTGGLTAADYELTVSSPGYSTQVINPQSIADDTVTIITLLP